MNNASSVQLPPSLSFARALLAQLIAQGVRDIVLCPGSRSAPLAYAAVVAERAGLVRLHVRIDERTAGFLALGLAKGNGGVPAAVVTTSGTAVANLHPSVLEAHHSDIPLIVLSADRPHELRGTGANQTTIQMGMFAGASRLALDCGVPAGAAYEQDDARAIGARAFAAAAGITGAPGPVHINVGFRDPLAPDAAQLAQLAQEFEGAPRPVVLGSRDVNPLTLAACGMAQLPVESLAEPAGNSPATANLSASPSTSVDMGVDPTLRTVIIAGDGAHQMAGVLASAQSWPILAEPSSGLGDHDCTLAGAINILAAASEAARPEESGRVEDGSADADSETGQPTDSQLDESWRSQAADLVDSIEQVVVFGHPTLTRPVQKLMAAQDVRTVVVPTNLGPWVDASRTADSVLYSLPPALLTGAATAAAQDWLAQWRKLHSYLDLTLNRVIDADQELTGAYTPMRVVRELVANAKPGDTLVFGASSAIRDADSYVTHWPTGVRVLAHRGLAGIDGTLSMALGVTLGQDSGRTRLLVGDLTFLHDSGALLRGPLEPQGNLDIIVLNDNGGAIFGGLEHAAAGDNSLYERVFGTSHVSDISALCAGYSVGHTSVTSTAELQEYLNQPAQGIRVAEVRFDRVLRAQVNAHLTQELDAVQR